MKAQVLIAGCLAALIALVVVWFRTNFEKVQTKEWVGATGEARVRQFLAAERFAERMGYEASEARSLPALDELPAGAILILPNGRQAFSPDRAVSLASWVAGGGHLVVEAEQLGVQDRVLDIFGVQRDRGPPAAKPLAIDVAAGRSLNVLVPGDMLLKPPAGREVHLRAGAADNMKLVSFGWRNGVVTVATNLHFARNRAIGLEDHAEFLWHLLSDADAPHLVVYWSPLRLSLWGFLQENAAFALIAVALLLALWLWSIGPRFGPVAPDAPPGRRRLLDHLRASGRYLWSTGLRSRLVVAARDSALRRLARAQPDFAAASLEERILRLASLANIDKSDAARFLSAAGAMRGADFIKVTQHAQRVHSALEKGAKQK